jgi:DNA-binding CsgD family transcriptional regulator
MHHSDDRNGGQALSALPLAGRETVLEQAQQITTEVARGRLGVWWFTGPPGTGKTRCLEEILSLAEARGWQTATIRVPPLPNPPPWSLCVYILDTCLARQDPVTQHRLIEGLYPLAWLLPDLPGVQPSSPPNTAQDRSLLYYALSRFLRRVVRQSPLVLGVDDWPFADVPSREALLWVLPLLARCPMLLVATARAGTNPTSPASDSTEAVGRLVPLSVTTRLSAFDLPQTAAALHQWLGAALPPALTRSLHARTGGLPASLSDLVAPVRAPNDNPAAVARLLASPATTPKSPLNETDTTTRGQPFRPHPSPPRVRRALWARGTDKNNKGSASLQQFDDVKAAQHRIHVRCLSASADTRGMDPEAWGVIRARARALRAWKQGRPDQALAALNAIEPAIGHACRCLRRGIAELAARVALAAGQPDLAGRWADRALDDSLGHAPESAATALLLYAAAAFVTGHFDDVLLLADRIVARWLSVPVHARAAARVLGALVAWARGGRRDVVTRLAAAEQLSVQATPGARLLLEPLIHLVRALDTLDRGQPAAAAVHASRARDSHDPMVRAWGLAVQAEAAQRCGRTATASAAREELDRQRTGGNLWVEAWADYARAVVHGFTHPQDAEEAWAQAVARFRRLGFPLAAARTALMGARYMAATDRAAAARSVAEATEVLRRLGCPIPAHQLRDMGLSARDLRSRLPERLLTPREQEIARLVADGLSTRAIARHLVVSPRTVENHLYRIYRRLKLSGRQALAAYVTDRSGGNNYPLETSD